MLLEAKYEAMMPETETVFFADDDGAAPLLEWLDEQDRKVQDKCLVKVDRLQELGYELRRPEADYLRDGIYELRVRHRSVHYRMLYFFHDQTRDFARTDQGRRSAESGNRPGHITQQTVWTQPGEAHLQGANRWLRVLATP